MSKPSPESAILNAIMSAAVDAIIVSDGKGQILRANNAAEKLFGFGPAELIGCNVRMLMPGEMAGHHDSFMQNYIETGEKKIIGIGRQVEGLRKDGEVFPLHLSVGDTKTDGARMFVAILRDDTLRVSNEAALARSQRLDAIGQMTGGVSHDFNNLLTVMIGNLELLEMTTEDKRQLKLCSEALQAAELASELTSRLMQFARRGKLKPVESDLREACKSTIALLERTLGARFKISTDFAPEISPALIDPVQFQTALINLALNARDAMPDGGELIISVADLVIDDTYMAQETDVEPGAYVRVMVSDNGEGMDAEAQMRAFEPFFTTKSETHGTGLGLAMVYGFVRQSGGHITLYSEKGYGTSFGLYFPALHKEFASKQPEQIAQVHRSPATGTAPCVLVVEDNEHVQRTTLERLAALGYETLSADNADMAYGIMKDGADVALVFSDVVMPGSMNGFDLAARLAEDYPHVKVLLTSGYASDVVGQTLPHDVEYDILHKPYQQRELAKRLQALLGDEGG